MYNYSGDSSNNLYYKNHLPGTVEGKEREAQDRSNSDRSNSDDDSINTGISSITRTVTLGGESSFVKKIPFPSSSLSSFNNQPHRLHRNGGQIQASSTKYETFTYDVLEGRHYQHISFYPLNNGKSSTHSSLLNDKVHIRVNSSSISPEKIDHEYSVTSTRSPLGCIQLDATSSAHATAGQTQNHQSHASANGCAAAKLFNVHENKNIQKDEIKSTNSSSLLPPRLPPKPTNGNETYEQVRYPSTDVNTNNKLKSNTKQKMHGEQYRVTAIENRYQNRSPNSSPEKFNVIGGVVADVPPSSVIPNSGPTTFVVPTPPVPSQVSTLIGITTLGQIGTTKKDFGMPMPPKEAVGNLDRNLSVCSTSSDYTTTSYHIRSDGSMTSDLIPPTLTGDNNIHRNNKRKVDEIAPELVPNLSVPIKRESKVDLGTNDTEDDNGIDNKHIYSKRSKTDEEVNQDESLKEGLNGSQDTLNKDNINANNSANVKAGEMLNNGVRCTSNLSSLTYSSKTDNDKKKGMSNGEGKGKENPNDNNTDRVPPSSCFNTLNTKFKNSSKNSKSSPKQIYEGTSFNAGTSVNSDNATKTSNYSKDTNTSKTHALFVSIKPNEGHSFNNKSPTMRTNSIPPMNSVTPNFRNPSPNSHYRNGKEIGKINIDSNTMTINVPNTPFADNGPYSNSSTMLLYHNGTGSVGNQGSMGGHTPLYYTTSPSSCMPNGTPTYYPHMNQQKQNHQHIQPSQQLPSQQISYYPPQVPIQAIQKNTSSQNLQSGPRSLTLPKPPSRSSTSGSDVSDTPNFTSPPPGKIDPKEKEILDCKKHPWTDEEDEQLKILVKQYGARDWGKIAANLHHRNGKQCHQRWNYFLNPMVRRGLWSKEEDELILFHQTQIGNKWAKIANYLPGRTGHAVKNRYHQIINGIRRGRSASEANVGGILGEMRNKQQNDTDSASEIKNDPPPLPPPPSMTTPQIRNVSSNVSINTTGNYGMSSNMSVTSQNSSVTGYNSLATNMYPMSSHSLQSASVGVPSQFSNMNFNPCPYPMVSPVTHQNHQHPQHQHQHPFNPQEIPRLHGGNVPHHHPQIVHHLKVNGNMFPFSQNPHY